MRTIERNLTATELGFVIFLITVAGKLHAMPSILAGFADESLWISAIINFVADFVLLLIILKILNGIKGRDFHEVLIERFGKIFGNAICFLYVLFMLCKVFIPILEQKNSVELTFYETQPTLFTYIPVYIALFYITLKGLRPFGKSVNVVIWGFVAGLIIVLSLSVSAIDVERLLPLFAKPVTSVLNGSKNSLLWYGDPLFLLFFSKSLKPDEKINKKIITFYSAAVAVYVLGLLIFYSIFENIAVRQYFAPLKMSKYSVTLSNIGRFDYIATLLIITANVYGLALPFVIASSLIRSALKIKNNFITPFVLTVISLITTFFTEHEFYSRLDFMQNYGLWFLLIMTYAVPVFTLIASRRKNERI